MLERALRPLRPLTPSVVLACILCAAAAFYAVAFLDPYVGLLMAPFFALGCARGKHPAVLSALALLPATLLLLGSYVKFRLVGVPLVTYDHYFLRKNIFILAYNDWRLALTLVISAAGLILYFRTLASGRGAFSTFERWSLAALVIVTCVCVTGLRTWDHDIAIWETGSNTPTLRTFVRSSTISKPQLRTVAGSETEDGTASLVAPAGVRPDVFFVLEESTFPPALLRPGYAPQKLFAQDAAQGGPLRVHTFAGGTWRTEFSVTVQMEPQAFGSDGLYVFHQLEGRIKRSVFTELKKLGYRTVVFYPVPGSFINAEAFYRSIGVDEFYDPESLDVSAGWNWTFPDAVLYRAMLKKLESSTQPVAAFMLTINQHGPHDLKDPMTDYVGRFADSDRAYGDFLKALAVRGRPAGVAIFGDHQPEFTARFLDDDHALHLTAYEIRCINFTCADSAGPDSKPIDAVMLAPQALERFGFTLDGLSLLQRKIFAACENDIDGCDENTRQWFNTAFERYFD